MPTWVRYLLLQIPGWIIAAIILIGLVHWDLISQWLALLCFGMFLLKDLVMYPFLKNAYETGVKTGSKALIGTRGVAHSALAPQGYVRVRGELWRAVALTEDRAIDCGVEVEIAEARGMTIFVRPVNGDQ